MVKRIAVIGPQGVGKTSLIFKYIKKKFYESYVTTIIGDTNIDMNGNVIWDTPGMIGWRNMFDIEIITKTVYGYILCFDPSIDTSFHEALTLIDSLEVEDKPVVLAACKTDILPFNIRPEWSTEAAARGWKIIGTSSKNNKGITRLFEEIFKIVLKEDEIVLGRLEYATDLMSSCIYTSINNYIYEFNPGNS